jgi:hypothetical protein
MESMTDKRKDVNYGDHGSRSVTKGDAVDRCDVVVWICLWTVRVGSRPASMIQHPPVSHDTCTDACYYVWLYSFRTTIMNV